MQRILNIFIFLVQLNFVVFTLGLRVSLEYTGIINFCLKRIIPINLKEWFLPLLQVLFHLNLRVKCLQFNWNLVD